MNLMSHDLQVLLPFLIDHRCVIGVVEGIVLLKPPKKERCLPIALDKAKCFLLLQLSRTPFEVLIRLHKNYPSFYLLQPNSSYPLSLVNSEHVQFLQAFLPSSN